VEKQQRLTQRRQDGKEKLARAKPQSRKEKLLRESALLLAFLSGFAALREIGFSLFFASWRLCVRPSFAVGAAT
jgi:hypothetical protein